MTDSIENHELPPEGSEKAKVYLTQTGQLDLLENEQSTDVSKIKIYAHSAVFFKQGNTGMMLRIIHCDQNYFHCRDENSEVRRHEIIDIPYSGVDLSTDTFYKLAAINY